MEEEEKIKEDTKARCTQCIEVENKSSNGEEKCCSRRLSELLLFLSISGARAADAGDVVLIDAPEGYNMKVQINKETRKFGRTTSLFKRKGRVNYRIEFERFAALTDVNSAR